MKIAVAGDIHLTNYHQFNQSLEDKPQSGTRLENILNGVDQFFYQSAMVGIKDYVINGDLFDKRQSDNPSTLAYIQKRVINAYHLNAPEGSCLYLNVGNHDELTRGIEPNALDNFFFYSNPSYRIEVANRVKSSFTFNETTNLVFVPYTEDLKESKLGVQQALKESTKDNIIVFAHTGVEGGVQGRWNHRLEGAYSLADLGWNDPRVKQIVCSHYHTRQVLKEDNNKKAWYVGDLTPLSFNDIKEEGYGAQRGFDILDTDTFTNEFVPLTDQVPTFNQFNYDEAKLKEYQKVAKDNYLRLVFNDAMTLSDFTAGSYNDFNQPHVQLTLSPHKVSEKRLEEKLEQHTNDYDLVKAYCEDKYPEVTKPALEYLMKAREE